MKQLHILPRWGLATLLMAAASGVVVAAGEAALSPERASGQVISIIGSKLMQPLGEAVMARLATTAGLPPAIIANQGSSSGIRVFCAGVGVEHPDIVAVSRRMRGQEVEKCHENGVGEIIEVQVGFEASVLISRKDDQNYPLSLLMLYKGIAAELPDGYTYVANRPSRWSQVDRQLPDHAIHLIIPTPDLGGRAFFEDRMLQGACRNVSEIKNIFNADDRLRQCLGLRKDGTVIEVPRPYAENVVETLKSSPLGTLAVVPMRFATENLDAVKLQPLNGVMPSIDTIGNRQYEFTRPLYFYVKKAHVKNYLGQGPVKGLREFITEITRESAIGEQGYLVPLGVFPMERKLREQVRDESLHLTNMIR